MHRLRNPEAETRVLCKKSHYSHSLCLSSAPDVDSFCSSLPVLLCPASGMFASDVSMCVCICVIAGGRESRLAKLAHSLLPLLHSLQHKQEFDRTAVSEREDASGCCL